MWTYEETSITLKTWMLVLAVVIAWRLLPTRRSPSVSRFKKLIRSLAHRPFLAAGLMVLTSLILSVALTAMRFPLPWTHDEYSYLLASDTFANGRLANPTHDHWQHFETFHVIHEPSYMSKYPPGQGLSLAIGQWLTGWPIVGAWLSLALATAAVYWMLRAWMPVHWATIAGFLVAIHAPMLRAWGQSYWGGSVAFLGGALIFGGLRRIHRDAKARDAFLLGAGMIILANSRPMEGFLASIPVFLSLFVWMFRESKINWQQKFKRVLAPVGAMGILGIGGLLAYNYSVTGDVLELPYKLHDQRYSASSLLVWSDPPPSPEYNHGRMEQFYHQWGRERQVSLQQPDRYVVNLGRKFRLLWDFMPLALGVCFLATPFCLRNRWMWFAVLTIVAILTIESQLATSWMYPHYLAPVVALFLVVNFQCLRYLRVLWRDRGIGTLLFRTVIVFAVLKWVPTIIDWQKPTRVHPRLTIATTLANHQGQHLVFVSYGPDYPIVDEWVFNEADIDSSRIVWARDMGPETNRELVKYFGDRNVWHWHLNAVGESELGAYGEYPLNPKTVAHQPYKEHQ